MAAVEGIGCHQVIYIWHIKKKQKKTACLKPGLDHDVLDQIKFQLQGFYFSLQILR